MAYLISKPTRREREERLSESRAKSPERNIAGVVRRTEEAFEIQRAREKDGIAFDQPYAVSTDAPESIQAEREVVERAGIDPDTYRPRKET